jgi:hypothetical protein
MQIEFKDGKISFDAYDLLSEMSDEQKLDLVERLSCEEIVIKHVAEQIFDGLTENFHSGAFATGSPSYTTALMDAQRRIANESGEVAEREISLLQSRYEHAHAQSEKYADAYFDLLHYAEDKFGFGSVPRAI